MANIKHFSKRQLEQLAEARRVIADAKNTSVQPRFDIKNDADYFYSTLKWAKGAFEATPPYSSDSRARSRWLNSMWPNEPYLAGVINSVVQINRNRGWSLIGGRNQVMRFTDILHNWQVQPGRASWREGVGAMAQGFYTTDMGGLAEIGRQFKGGPMAGMYHLDPLRCVMTSRVKTPIKYYPRQGKIIDLNPYDYMRVASQISIDETYNGLGYSALSRCVELGIIMVAILRHEQEMLFARAPKGLLLLKGISEQTWKNGMVVRDATLDNRQQEWYGAVAVLASSGTDDVDAKMVALSQLPDGFDQKTFTDLLMYGYSLCFGYDAREFWPVSSGSMGTATETETQHRKATDKGGSEFHLGLQEEIQSNLPDTLHFEFDERSVEGDLAEAALQKAQVDVIYAMGADLSLEQRLTLLAEQGIIPREWTEIEEDVEATDVEDADENNADEDVDGVGETPEDEEVPEEVAQMLQLPEVQRALHAFPDEPISVYRWSAGRGKTYDLPVKTKRKTVHPIAQIMARLAAEIEHSTETKLKGEMK